jgi:short subunit dehydrogenase-like uncharacterized protein
MAGRDDWLLYGAYGYTGRLLTEEAFRRGHRPILAGRNREKLRGLVGELWTGGVGSAARGAEAPGESPRPPEYRVLPLDDPRALREGITGLRAVLHAAGPFKETARPMMEACLDAGVHYLDITGEVPVFEAAFHLDRRAREAGVVLMPGVGLDVVPTDGVAAHLSAALPSATRLELALHSPGRASSGTLQTVVEGVSGGLRIRRGGRLQEVSPGAAGFRERIDFGPEVQEGPMAGRLGGERTVAPFTWGDLSTAWRTTGIGDITCYLSVPPRQARLLPLVLPLVQRAMAVDPLRRFVRGRVAARPGGPDEEARRVGRTRVWGRVEDDGGAWREVVAEFPEGYRFTGMAGVRALEEVLALPPGTNGTLTPAGTFGAEWVFGLPEVVVVLERG